MLMGTRKAITPLLSLALAGVVASGCGSDDEKPAAKQPPPISRATANQLATLSERIATDLDAGETCDAAYAADQLNGAVSDSELSASLRPGVEQVASRLVDEVNCPPPPEPKPKKKEKPKPGKHDEEHGGDEQQSEPPGHTGGLPPGKAKLKGEFG
jgi:hypothetical protein